MSGHVCALPPRDGRRLTYSCLSCGWQWRFNTIVKRWFRYIPTELAAG